MRPARSPALPRRLHLLAIVVILIVAVPTLVFEELYRGIPMIDQATTQWRIPGAIVTGGFVLGGCLAAHRSPRPVSSGLLTGLTTALLLVGVDIGRRLLITRQLLTWPVAGLWLVATLVAAAASAVGGLLTLVWRLTR